MEDDKNDDRDVAWRRHPKPPCCKTPLLEQTRMRLRFRSSLSDSQGADFRQVLAPPRRLIMIHANIFFMFETTSILTLTSGASYGDLFASHHLSRTLCTSLCHSYCTNASNSYPFPGFLIQHRLGQRAFTNVFSFMPPRSSSTM